MDEGKRPDPAPIWTPLPWDSEFFGFGVGQVELAGLTAEDLRRIEAEARAADVRCLYGSLDARRAESLVLSQQHGYRMVVASVLHDLDPEAPAIPKPEGVEVRVGTADDIDELTDLALKMADWSRYAVDPRFGIDAARRMQLAWLDRAARNEDGVHSLLVAEEGGSITAFIGRVDGEEPRIDAVATHRRGNGAARYLMAHAREWADGRRLLAGPIAARNVASLRYVAHTDYIICDVTYLFHRWLDEPIAV